MLIQAHFDPCEVRERQIARLWQVGIGRVLAMPLREFSESVPERIPENLLPGICDRLVLVPRRMSLFWACRLVSEAGAQVDFWESAHAMRDADGFVRPEIEWIWCHDGRRNLFKTATETRHAFVRGEAGMNAVEALMMVLQDPLVMADGMNLVLTGSVGLRDAEQIGKLCQGKYGYELLCGRDFADHNHAPLSRAT